MNNLFRGVGRLSNVVMDRASGSFVTTSSGQRLLDFTSGIGVTNTGHCHPQVVSAAKEQCDKLVHGQVNLGYHGSMLELTEELMKPGVMPHEKLDRIFYATTGAEAVENAVKLAKYATGRPNIICFQGGYHGRTHMTMALTSSSVIYRQRMASPNNVFVSPFPYELHGQTAASCLEDLEMIFKTQTLQEEVAAVIIEPVLGEGGYVQAPTEFMNGLHQICDQHGIIFIMDEVQTGFGRTGELFASSLYPDCPPDILVMAKGLASGFPLSAIAAKAELADTQDPGTMGGTYAGNAVSCAAAIATQKVIHDERLVENASKQGERLKEGLLQFQKKYDIIRDVRGPGCMIGVELRKDVKPGTNKELSLSCLDHGMLLLPASVFPTVRFIPPLTVSEEEIDMGLDIFEKALNEVSSRGESDSVAI